MRIAVVGAGIGGLAAAVGLQQAGAEVVILERSVELRTLGAGLSLFGNGLTALDALGLAAQLQAQTGAAAALRAGQRRPDGDWLAITPPSALRDLRVVHRAALQELLVNALQAGTLLSGIDVQDVYGPAGAVVLRGRRHDVGEFEAAYDLVVAADGLRSRIRASWPNDPGLRYAGYTAWRGVTEEPVDLGGAAGETWGRGQRFGMAPLADGRVYWFAVAQRPAGERLSDEHAEVTRLYAGWHRPITVLIAATPPTAVLRHDVHDLARPLRTFRRGGSILVGDAAHAMTPDLGQGGNLALEDGVTLSRLLAELVGRPQPDPAAVATALGRYDRLRRRRTQPVVRQARRVGQLAQLSAPVAVGLRNALLRGIPASATAGRLEALQAWQPPASAGPSTDLAPTLHR